MWVIVLLQQRRAMLPLQESGAKLTSQLAALTALVRSPLEEHARRKVAALVSWGLSALPTRALCMPEISQCLQCLEAQGIAHHCKQAVWHAFPHRPRCVGSAPCPLGTDEHAFHQHRLTPAVHR